MKLNELKIALFIANMHGGGAERMMLNLAAGFAERGCKVDLVLGKAEGSYLNLVPRNVNLIDLKSPRILLSPLKLRRYLKREKPDILISTLSRVNIASVIAKKLSGVNTKLYLREAATFSVYSKGSKTWWEKTINFFAKLFYPMADEIIAVSDGVAKDLVEFAGLSQSRVKLIYNPVVSKRIFEMAAEKVDHSWISENNVPLIMGMGRFDKQKDFETLIFAFKEVLKKRNARLMILGEKREDNEYPRIKNLVEELGLEEKVYFPGFVDNPFAYLSKASVFVLSSRYEGLPGALIQALACGCPVVSTDCPSGPREILNDGEFGRLVEIGDYISMSEKILETLESETDKIKLINRAKVFSVDKAVDGYLNLMKNHF